MGLEGKRILIAGVTPRIGRNLAEVKAPGRKASLLKADLTDPAETAGLIGRALEHDPLFARLNNAVIFQRLALQDSSLAGGSPLDEGRHLA